MNLEIKYLTSYLLSTQKFKELNTKNSHMQFSSRDKAREMHTENKNIEKELLLLLNSIKEVSSISQQQKHCLFHQKKRHNETS